VSTAPAEWIVPPRWIIPQWPVPARVRALSTTRAGGASGGPYSSFNVGTAVGDDPASVAANRALLRDLLPAEPSWLRQVHGTRLVDAASLAPGEVPEADAAVTRTPGMVLAIQAADCMPVLLAHREGKVIAAAHAGWRGLSGGVIENAVAGMDVPAGDIVAWLGPAISGPSYEVGEDVRQAFLAADPHAAAGFAAGAQPGKYWLDLYALARQRLQRLGVASVHGGGFCTLKDSERFYSYRRDGATGRMATLLWLES
jgi:YfiH family protein